MKLSDVKARLKAAEEYHEIAHIKLGADYKALAYALSLIERMKPFVRRFDALQRANGIQNDELAALLKEIER